MYNPEWTLSASEGEDEGLHENHPLCFFLSQLDYNMNNNRWSPGDKIIYRGLWKGSVYWAVPVTVIQDTTDAVVLYWPAGTPVKRPERRATVEELYKNPKPILSDSFWTDTDVLLLCNEGKPYSINAMWSADNGNLLCWYVNIQAPLQRLAIGFETEDYLLDVVFHPNLSNWELKDEDELADALKIGLYEDQKVKDIYAAAKEAIQDITSGESPISKKWSSWVPPQARVILEMPENWDSQIMGS